MASVLYALAFAVLLLSIGVESAGPIKRDAATALAQADVIISEANGIKTDIATKSLVFQHLGNIQKALSIVLNSQQTSTSSRSSRDVNGFSLAGGILDGIGDALKGAGGG